MEIRVCIWEVMSLIIIICMVINSNCRIEQIMEKANESDSYFIKYVWNFKSVMIFWVIILISMYIGYIVSLKAVSDIAWIELNISFQLLLGAMVVDYKLHIIPNIFPSVMAVSKILILAYEMIDSQIDSAILLNCVLGGILCFAVLTGAERIFPGGIGKGDIKLLAAFGFFCGTYIVFSVLLWALLCCLVVSGILLLLKKISLKDYLPFGPFIWTGYVCMILFMY